MEVFLEKICFFIMFIWQNLVGNDLSLISSAIKNKVNSNSHMQLIFSQYLFQPEVAPGTFGADAKLWTFYVYK